MNIIAIFAVMNTAWAVVKKGHEKSPGLYGIWDQHNDQLPVDDLLP